MQRLFSMFPVGWPGIGLLCLRLAVALSLGLVMPSTQIRFPAVEWAMEILGFLLVIGFATPILAVLAALVGICGLSDMGNASWEYVVSWVLVACALALLGPGAYSVDARLFGRRSVILNSPGDKPERRS